MLKDECEGLELSLNVGAFTVDFELAMLKAIRSVFGPDTNIRGCRFHLAQAWMKYIDSKEVGLKNKYRDQTSEEGRWLARLFGLPGLKSEEVGEFFIREYAPTAPKTQNFRKLTNYLINTYMKPNARYPPKMWASICHIDFKTTTNCCESWHRRFGEFFNSRKGNPNIYEFLVHLDEDDLFNDIKSRSKKSTKEADEKKKHLEETYARLDAKEINKVEFLSVISGTVIVRQSSRLLSTDHSRNTMHECTKCKKQYKSKAWLGRHSKYCRGRSRYQLRTRL